VSRASNVNIIHNMIHIVLQ